MDYFRVLVPLVLRNNVALVLHDRGYVYTKWGVIVMPSEVIVNWVIVDIHNPPTLHVPLYFIDFHKIQDNTGTDGNMCSFLVQEVLWWAHISLLPQDEHWFSCTNLFHIFRCNSVIWYWFYLVWFPIFGSLGRFEASLGGHVLVGWLKW